MELDQIGGVFGGNVKPTPFLCLILKMLQIQPSKDIVVEFIKNPDYKLVCCLSVCVSVCLSVCLYEKEQLLIIPQNGKFLMVMNFQG